MNVVAYNQQAWDEQVRKGNTWTLPVGAQAIESARAGVFSIVLTPSQAVPADWFPALKGTRVLALASGGGQQGPILAAAGADVTVYDLSAAQLAQDDKTAREFGLKLTLVQGDMADLSALANASFDLVFHPCSNLFAPALVPVWKECARVLRPGGILMWGFCKAESLLLVEHPPGSQSFELRYRMPYSDQASLSEDERAVFLRDKEPLVFGHTLEDQIGGLLRNGFQLTHLFEDDWGGKQALDGYFKAFVAARAVKV